jgi:bifunctional non-homologous end joining protein LigD
MIKFDAYPVQVHLRDAGVKVFTRRGHDWTYRFKKLVADAWHIKAGNGRPQTTSGLPRGNGHRQADPARPEKCQQRN